MLGTYLGNQKQRPHSLQLTCSRQESLLGKGKQMTWEGFIEHQQGQGSPCPQKLLVDMVRMKLKNK